MFLDNRDAIIVDHVGVQRVRFINKDLDIEAVHGWITFDTGLLDMHVPEETVRGEGENTPSFPDCTFEELWAAVEKTGFPLSDIEPREKAMDMVQHIFDRYGRPVTHIKSWLHDMHADKYLGNFKAAKLATLEDIGAMDIGFNDLKKFGIRDMKSQKHIYANLVAHGVADGKPDGVAAFKSRMG